MCFYLLLQVCFCFIIGHPLLNIFGPVSTQVCLFLYTFISFTFQGRNRYRSFCSGRTLGALVKTIKYSKLRSFILVILVCNLTLHLTLPYFLPYLTIPYVLPHLTLSCVLFYLTLPYLMSYLTLQYLTLSYPTLSRTLQYVLPYHTLGLTLP